MTDVLALLTARAGQPTPSRLHDRITGTTRTLTDILNESRSLAAGLRRQGIGLDDPVGLLVPPGRYFPLLAAVWRLGAIPVPLPLPFGRPSDYQAHLTPMLAGGGIQHLILAADHQPLTAALPALNVIIDEGRLTTGAALDDGPALGKMAVLQFTSGSTGPPRPVRLSHANVVAGLTAIRGGLHAGPDDLLGVALPLFHDMGLFSSLHGLVHCQGVALWAPQAVLRDPTGWLADFAGLGCTIAPVPQFMMATLAATQPTPDTDLRTWRAAIHGADVIDPQLIQQFQRALAPAGLPPDAVVAAYGLAEATLAVAFCPAVASRPNTHFDRRTLTPGSTALPCTPENPSARPLISVGTAVPGLRLRIRTDDGSLAAAGTVGQIEIEGAAVTSGYRGAPGRGTDWLPTGDQGFLHHGSLYVTGRAADVILAEGGSWSAEDLESLVRRQPGIWHNHCVAVAHDDGLALVAETTADPHPLAQQIRAQLAAAGAPAAAVWCLPPRSLPFTTSGKNRRHQVRAQLTAGTYGPPTLPAPTAVQAPTPARA